MVGLERICSTAGRSRWGVRPVRSPHHSASVGNRSTACTISSLTVQIYAYASSPYEDWHRQAWAGALVLVTIVFLCSILARLATRRLEAMQ